MQEEDGVPVEGFSDKWESFDDYTDWYANVINSCWTKLNKNGWMYAHNNFMGNALVMSKIDRKIREILSIQISLGRDLDRRITSRMVGVTSWIQSWCLEKAVHILRLSIPHSILCMQANSFKNKDDVGYYALAKVTGERVDHAPDLNTKVTTLFMGSV